MTELRSKSFGPLNPWCPHFSFFMFSPGNLLPLLLSFPCKQQRRWDKLRSDTHTQTEYASLLFNFTWKVDTSALVQLPAQKSSETRQAMSQLTSGPAALTDGPLTWWRWWGCTWKAATEILPWDLQTTSSRQCGARFLSLKHAQVFPHSLLPAVFYLAPLFLLSSESFFCLYNLFHETISSTSATS